MSGWCKVPVSHPSWVFLAPLALTCVISVLFVLSNVGFAAACPREEETMFLLAAASSPSTHVSSSMIKAQSELSVSDLSGELCALRHPSGPRATFPPLNVHVPMLMGEVIRFGSELWKYFSIFGFGGLVDATCKSNSNFCNLRTDYVKSPGALPCLFGCYSFILIISWVWDSLLLSKPTLSREKQVINKVSSPEIFFFFFFWELPTTKLWTKSLLRFEKARRVLTRLWEASLWHSCALGCNLQAHWEMNENLVFYTQSQDAS